MTDPRRQAFAPYLRQLADLMGLKDWDIDIDDEGPTNYMAIAACRVDACRKNACIDLGSRFLEMNPDRQRHALVHELVHAHFAAQNHVLHKMLTEAQYEVHIVQMEYAVDGIAFDWAKLLPMPFQCPTYVKPE